MHPMASESGNGAEAAPPDHRDLHVAMFPFLAFGHIDAFVGLSNKLASQGVAVTFLTSPANAPRVAAMLSTSVRVASLELPHVDGLPEGAESTADMTPEMAELLKEAVDLMRPQVEVLLAELRPQAVFHDFALPWLPSVTRPLCIKTIFFNTFNTLSTAFLTVPARRDRVDELHLPPPGFPDRSESAIQSVPAYQAADFAYIFKRFTDAPTVYERVVSCIQNSSAVAYRSCVEIEGPYIRYVESQFSKTLLLAGPSAPAPPAGELEQRWAEWLDRFPEKSVVFCAFGSENFLSDAAIREVALGLEMTGLPFLLVLNFPKRKENNGEPPAAELMRRKLPEGFEERVQGRGAVHSGWVQQQQLLRHRSVGCFLCHAGLSSVLEGVASGLPLVMLPQKGDQFLNARLYGDGLGVGVEVKRRQADGAFEGRDVRDAVTKVTAAEGEEVRENVRRWREFIADEGTHRRYMRAFVEKLRDLVAEGNHHT